LVPFSLIRACAGVALATLVSAVAYAQPADALLTPRQAQADLDVARKSLEEAHGALYRFTPKPALDRRFDAIRARVTAPVSRRELFGLVNEMMAATGDGHARVDPDDSTAAQFERALRFPLKVALEGSRLFVLTNDTPNDTTIRPGMEIVSVNGHTVPEMIARIMPAIRGDGFIETGRRNTLGSSFPARFWYHIDTSSTYTIEARAPGGAPVKVTLRGVLNAGRSAANAINDGYRAGLATLGEPSANISVRRVGDSSVAVLKIRSFVGEPWVPALDSVMAVVHEWRVPSLVLDLRGNSGGTDMYGATLVSHFTDKPFRYFDHIHFASIDPSFANLPQRARDRLKEGTVAHAGGGYRATRTLHEGVAEQQPAARPFLGRLVVLIDGGTFSTSADVTSVLRSMNRATFIGEETGGAYEGNTSGMGARATLPNSGIKVFVQLYGYVNAVRPAEKGRGTLPDITVPRTIEQTLRGEDAGLARAIEVLRRR
jgi:hypothetical protein